MDPRSSKYKSRLPWSAIGAMRPISPGAAPPCWKTTLRPLRYAVATTARVVILPDVRGLYPFYVELVAVQEARVRMDVEIRSVVDAEAEFGRIGLEPADQVGVVGKKGRRRRPIEGDDRAARGGVFGMPCRNSCAPNR